MTNATYPHTLINKKYYQNEIDKRTQINNNENQLSFDELVRQHPNIPELTALLGKSGRMPLLFDLEDPRPGSIIMVNDHLPSIRKLMTVIMKSLVTFSHATSVQFITLSHYPEKWLENIQVFDPQFSYCAGVSGDYENSAEDWIHYLTNISKDRLSGRNKGTAAILFIDDCELINKFEIQTRLNFEWLLRNGASARIWVISGLNLQNNLDPQSLLSKYKTRIFGFFDRNQSTNINKFVPNEYVKNLAPERNFVTKISSSWIQFWSPKL